MAAASPDDQEKDVPNTCRPTRLCGLEKPHRNSPQASAFPLLGLMQGLFAATTIATLAGRR